MDPVAVRLGQATSSQFIAALSQVQSPLSPTWRVLLNESTNFGVVVGVLFAVVYLLLIFRQKLKPSLSQLAVILLSCVAATSGLSYGFTVFKTTKEQLGLLGEHRLSMILGALAVIYTAIEEIIKIYYPLLRHTESEPTAVANNQTPTNQP